MAERAAREHWPSRPHAGRGGGVEYPITCLPPAARDELLRRVTAGTVSTAIVATPSSSPTSASDDSSDGGALAPRAPEAIAASLPPPEHLKDWQRRAAEARGAICLEIECLAATSSIEQAIRSLAERAAQDEEFGRLVAVANARRGEAAGRGLSRRTVYRWLAERQRGFAALAPRATSELQVPVWGAAAIELYQQPQKPALATIVAELPQHLPAGIEPPSYYAVRRLLGRMGAVEREAGRMLARELIKLRPFVRRDTSTLAPCDVYTADGHTFDAEIAHPFNGRPFRPEITTVLDVATHKIVGFSIGLAESTWTVLDAWRRAVEAHGVNAIFYVDRGAGFKNRLVGDEVTGFAARLGTEVRHSLPYRSQSRGLIERAHRTVWTTLARRFPTYIGADMDPEAKQRSFKLTRKEIRELGSSRRLLPIFDFIRLANAAVAQFNARPTRSLPKIEGEHLSPDDAWSRAVDAGFEAQRISPAEADDLFRPYVKRSVKRCEVSIFNNTYFSAALEDYNDESVRVGYDLHDASRVWIRDLEGRLLAIAQVDGNRRAYFPQSAIDSARAKRARGRERRLEAQLEDVRQELSPPAQIEHAQQFTWGTQVPVSEAAGQEPAPRVAAEQEALPRADAGVAGDASPEPVDPDPRPSLFAPGETYAAWVERNPTRASEHEHAWAAGYRKGPSNREFERAWEDVRRARESEREDEDDRFETATR